MLSFLIKNNILKEVEINNHKFIVIKKIGDFKKFSSINCKGNDYLSSDGSIISSNIYASNKLSNGAIIEVEEDLIFKASSKCGLEYINYIYDYLKTLNEFEQNIFDKTINKQDFIRMNSYLKMFIEGSISETTLCALVGNKMLNLDSLISLKAI